MSDLRTPAASVADEAVALAEPPAVCDGPRRTTDAGASVTIQDPLAATIIGEIRQLTRSGVRDLEIHITPDAIRLRGRCSTYYCKQLAQHAAMHWVGKARLYNEIEVW